MTGLFVLVFWVKKDSVLKGLCHSDLHVFWSNIRRNYNSKINNQMTVKNQNKA